MLCVWLPETQCICCCLCGDAILSLKSAILLWHPCWLSTPARVLWSSFCGNNLVDLMEKIFIFPLKLLSVFHRWPSIKLKNPFLFLLPWVLIMNEVELCQIISLYLLTTAWLFFFSLLMGWITLMVFWMLSQLSC